MNAQPLGGITSSVKMAYIPEKKGPKRNYHDWYNYESRKLVPSDALWMTLFAVVLCGGLPLGFAALFRYGIPLLAKYW